MMPHSWHASKQAAVDLAVQITAHSGAPCRVVEDKRDLKGSGLSMAAQAMRFAVEVDPDDEYLVDMEEIYRTGEEE